MLRFAALTALAAASISVPASAERCAKVIVFSGVAAGRGVNPGVVGCAAPGEVSTNLITPGAQTAIVAWTGSRTWKPAGTIEINGAVKNLTGANWDAVDQRWTFTPTPLPVGPATVRATAYPEADPSRAESVTYRKPL